MKTIIVYDNVIIADNETCASRVYTHDAFVAWRFLVETYAADGLYTALSTPESKSAARRQLPRDLATARDAALIAAADYLLRECWIYRDVAELTARIKSESALFAAYETARCWILLIDGIDRILRAAALFWRGADEKEFVRYYE